MKKIIATQCDPEMFDYRAYLDEYELEQNNIWVGGNRDFCDLNDDLYTLAANILDNCSEDLDQATGETEEEINADKVDTIKYYFNRNNFNFECKEELTDEEIKSAFSLIEDFNNQGETYEMICKVLSLLARVNFTYKTLSGYSQGDWVKCIYPETVSDKYIKFLEAVYFGTGTEYEITCGLVDTETYDPEDHEDTYFDYTYLYNTEDIKEWIAKNYNCQPEDVILRNIKDTYTTKHFVYEEE